MTDFLKQLPKHIRDMAELNVCTPELILVTSTEKFLDTRVLEEDRAKDKSSFQSVLTKTNPHYCYKLEKSVSNDVKCKPEDVRQLKDAAAKWLAQSPVAADSLLQPPACNKWSHLSFGCASLDRCTGGGVSTRGITEICGAAGVGKTQLLLQLSLCAQLPTNLGGLGRGVAYICTEDVFPSRRLLQISKAFETRYPDQKLRYMSNVFIEQLYDSEPLLNCVCKRLPKLLEQQDIGLIIVDSVAAIFRLYTDFIERARDLRRFAHALLGYVDKYKLAVVCSNQMTASSANSENGTLQDMPCLGLQWAQLVRTHLRISKGPRQHWKAAEMLSVRKLEVVFSPDTPNQSTEFFITSDGVVDMPVPPDLEVPSKRTRR
ncbi:DNA repair protein XRCC3-like isoform X2 [Scaptodrosophila lebanonensis]|uniref:DNA repair protein XRCC3-like isoform X2 n=1 Tax=Drosophila lebanonensis TaxID=7225 RepID=A0A6J2TPL2_DROLE|nr:DNA repair protein XRCC3-like isoform X2 [Scaptodrosophila lebanonensis]